MGTPAITVNLSATLDAASGTIAIGNVLIDDSSTGYYVKATTANRGTRRAHGIALTAWSSSTTGSVQLQTGGIVDASTTGLGAGAVSWVRTSATGTCERCTPASGDDLLGKCDANGNLFLDPGKWDSTNYTSSSGGTPGGSSGDIQYNNAGAFGGITPGTGVSTWIATPSGANLASALTTALPASKGGTGLTSLGSNVATWLGTPSGANLASALSSALPTSKGGTGVDSSASSGVWKVTAGTWATITLASGVETFLTTPSGANLASALTSALPDSKGGTGLTALGGGVATWLGTPSGANLASALTSALTAAKGGTGIDTSATTGVPKIAAGTWSSFALGTGVETFLTTPSGANLASALTTALPVSKGGTNQTALGTANQVLRTNGTATDTEWATVSGTSPAGASGDWQKNSAGSFGAFTPAAGVETFVTTPSSANLASAVTDETGSGALCFATSPLLVTPTIADSAGGQKYIFAVSNLAADRTVTLPLLTGNDTFVFNDFAATLTNKTINGASNTLTVRLANDISGFGANVATMLATFSSANIATACTDETGSGALVFGTAPTISSAVLTANPAFTTFTTNSSTGTINNVSRSSSTIVEFTNATGPTVTGFDATGAVDGTILWVYVSGGNVLLSHEDAGSSAANRMTLSSGINITATTGTFTQFVYRSSRWRALTASAI